MPRIEEELLRLINSAYLFIFVCELSVVFIILMNRVREYRLAKWEPPHLLRRDIILFGGILLPFLAIFVRRWLDLDLGSDLIWVIATGTPPVLAVGYWLYVELFQLGR